MRRLLKWTSVAAFVAYAVLCVGLYAAQRKLVFPPRVLRLPRGAGDPGAHVRRRKAHCVVRGASKADKLLVVYFHGNGDTLSWRTNRDRLLMADGTKLLAISYCGFPALGGPTGGHRRADPTGRCPRLVTATLVFAGSGVDNTCVFCVLAEALGGEARRWVQAATRLRNRSFIPNP